MILIDLCTNSNILLLFVILKYGLSIVCTIIPLIVMFNAIVPLFKSVLKPDDLKQAILPIAKSALAGLIIFFLPTLFSFVFTDLLGNNDATLSNCFTNATIENVNRLKEKEKQERKQELSQNKQETEEEIKKRQEEENKKNETIKQQREEEEERRRQEEAANNANNGNNSNNGNNEENANNTGNNTAYGDIFVGDSRTVGYKGTISLKGTDAIYATSGGAMKEFNSDVSQALAKINNDPSHRYNLILNYGVNNLSQDWVTAYKNIINQVDGRANILIVSGNPCNDSIARYCRNANVENFNQKLSSAFSNYNANNVKYCDTYTPFINTPNYTRLIETKEGIHYTKEGYQLIYDKIQSCLSSF